jgi:hypothetical protein
MVAGQGRARDRSPSHRAQGGEAGFRFGPVFLRQTEPLRESRLGPAEGMAATQHLVSDLVWSSPVAPILYFPSCSNSRGNPGKWVRILSITCGMAGLGLAGRPARTACRRLRFAARENSCRNSARRAVRFSSGSGRLAKALSSTSPKCPRRTQARAQPAAGPARPGCGSPPQDGPWRGRRSVWRAPVPLSRGCSDLEGPDRCPTAPPTPARAQRAGPAESGSADAEAPATVRVAPPARGGRSPPPETSRPIGSAHPVQSPPPANPCARAVSQKQD